MVPWYRSCPLTPAAGSRCQTVRPPCFFEESGSQGAGDVRLSRCNGSCDRFAFIEVALLRLQIREELIDGVLDPGCRKFLAFAIKLIQFLAQKFFRAAAPFRGFRVTRSEVGN